MKFKNKVFEYLNEKKDSNKSYKILATRLSKDLNKKITSSQIENYLKRMNKKLESYIKRKSKRARNPYAYKMQAKYRILRGHFDKS